MIGFVLVAQVAAADTAVRVTVAGFVDTYYAWDSGRPATHDRSFAGGALFTTQPARHNEFNVNLAFLEANVTAPRVRGRLAVQFGTSVVSNYGAEPNVGQVSGGSASRYLQEAFAGFQVTPTLWVDGGIFFSHIGMEGWISRDNPTYTRSLVAEYSPYYQTGVRAIWTPTATLTARVDVVNGWQNISENNSGKGAGARVDYAFVPNVTVSYYNLFTDESGNRLRTLNGVGGKASVGRVTLLGELDRGTQAKSDANGERASWVGFTMVAKAQASARVAFSTRVERFVDDDQIVISTGIRDDGTANPAFRGNSASVGVDVTPAPRLLWRWELRGFQNARALFPDGDSSRPSRRSVLAVSSVSLTF